ncbi:MAG: SAM-dependent methyltransferase [Actinomycetota bacterium]
MGPTERLRRAIAETGPVTFATFMEAALLGQGGFFEEPPVGTEGAFLTAPHVHPVFIDLVRFAIGDLRASLGSPEPLRLVDLGAGDGTLLAGLVDGFRDVDGVTIDAAGVDASGGARRRLAARGVAAAAHLTDLPPGDPAVVVANELLDNLPFRWLRSTEDGFREIRIDDVDGEFVPIETPCDAALADLAGDTPEGCDAFVSPAALDLVDDLATWLRRGYALVIDYGWPDRPAREVHGYRDHRFVGDVLGDPGSRDITAGVDFGAIERHARDRGLVVLGSATQADALRALGYDAWQAQQRDRQAAMLGSGDHLRALRAWEGRGLASVLVDPERLGGFRWLLLATPGLPAPDWL